MDVLMDRVPIDALVLFLPGGGNALAMPVGRGFRLILAARTQLLGALMSGIAGRLSVVLGQTVLLRQCFRQLGESDVDVDADEIGIGQTFV